MSYNKDKSDVLNIRLNHTDKRRLERLADERNSTMSIEARRAIKQYMEE